MLVYTPAALLFLVFCVRVVRERRKFSNAVILGLAVLCGLAAWIFQLVRSGSRGLSRCTHASPGAAALR